MAAYSNMPDGMEPGLENNAYYDPPNLTWPFACYIATVEVDPETGVWDVLNVVAVDDCGVRINPMIVEGQIMGGLTEAYAMASMQFITFDAEGNCVGSNYMDYLLPTAWETPGLRAARGRHAVPAPPDRRQGHRRVRHRRRPGRVRQRGDGRPQGHRRPQHRHAAAARPGLRGADRAPRRVRRAAGQVGRLMRPARAVGRTAGTSSSRPASWPGAARSSRWPPSSGGRARRPASRARAPSSPRPASCYGWIGGACAEPVVIREAQRAIADGEPRLLLLGTPEQFGARPRRHDGHPDRLPERGRPGGLRRAGAGQPRTWSSSAARRWRTRWPTWPARSAGAPDLVDGADFTRRRRRRPLDRRRRHPGPRRRGGDRAGGAGRPGVRRAGRLAHARRGRARLPGRPGRARGACSTGCGCRSGSTSGTRRTARSPSRSWPSWCSCGRPARSSPAARPATVRRRGPATGRSTRSAG